MSDISEAWRAAMEAAADRAEAMMRGRRVHQRDEVCSSIRWEMKLQADAMQEVARDLRALPMPEGWGPRRIMADNRIEYDDRGKLDEVVTDGGAHLERLGKDDWFLAMYRADGSAYCVWIEGKVTMTEERARHD